jgi:hypothetical protein
VLSVFKCIGNFINYAFRKAKQEWVVADVSNFGSAVRSTS